MARTFKKLNRSFQTIESNVCLAIRTNNHKFGRAIYDKLP